MQAAQLFQSSTWPKLITRYEKIILVLILLITLTARLHFIFTSPKLVLTHDEIGYHVMTLRFITNGYMGYYSLGSNAFVTPGYPAFLIGVYYMARLIHADPLTTTRIFQVIISIGSLYLVYHIARKGAGQAAGILAAVLVAIYPSSFMANNRILTEVLYIFLLLAYIYSVIIAFTKNTLGWHALSGAVLALSVLVRPAGAPFMVVPYIIYFIKHRDFKVFQNFIIAVIAFCLVMAPWWVRNYLVFDKFIMFATQTGDPLLRGTKPYDVYDKIGPSIIANTQQSERAALAVKRIKEGFRTQPLLWFKWFTVGKFSYLWFKPWGVDTTWAKFLHLWVFVILGWVGTVLNLRDRILRWPALVVLFFAALQMAFIPIERYIYPLTPIMAIMAATLIVKTMQNRLDFDRPKR